MAEFSSCILSKLVFFVLLGEQLVYSQASFKISTLHISGSGQAGHETDVAKFIEKVGRNIFATVCSALKPFRMVNF